MSASDPASSDRIPPPTSARSLPGAVPAIPLWTA